MEEIAFADAHHWRLDRDVEDIVWLSLDCRDRSTNALSSPVLRELHAALERVAQEHPRGLVIGSGKPGGFIAGADVTEFERQTDPDATVRQLGQVHEMFGCIEQFRFPSVARIHGFCLGGGLELALACRHRVALDDPGTRLGFPEIMLGIHPGFGGTLRAVRDLGVFHAMDLMLTGRMLDARQAWKLGLVDHCVPERHLDAAARHLILAGAPRSRAPRLARLAGLGAARPAVAALLKRAVAKRAAERDYPAPYALIRLWRDHGGNAREMLRHEAQSVARLLPSATARNLTRLFFVQERLKSAARDVAFAPAHVHVIGAGTMGGDIAAWCVLRGMRVTLQDRAVQYVAPAVRRAHGLFAKRLRDVYRRREASNRLIVDLAGDGARRADVVIEAIVEDLEAKRGLFRDLETRVKPGALLATNTSSIPLEQMASELSHPERLVGVHFFNPVEKMRLVEIIASAVTDPLELRKACTFAVLLDRLPLPAASAPGFLINRILSPYLQEAMMLVEEGVPARAIDAIARDFGMPMGPLELADAVGLDICLAVGEVLAMAVGGAVPEVLRRHVAAGRLGLKTGRGFHAYRGLRWLRLPRAARVDPDACDRLVLRLLNEAVACLRQGIAADADSIDAGMVFGTGFAPFRGGPLRYAADRGTAEIRARLEELAARYGDRFTPDPGWSTL